MSSPEGSTVGALLVAIPVAQGRLCPHFGHCEQFALVAADRESKQVLGQRMVDPPPHEPGSLPKWLHDWGVDLVITGGMGRRAQQLFSQYGIGLVVGAPDESPEAIVDAYLKGTLQAGQNICDH